MKETNQDFLNEFRNPTEIEKEKLLKYWELNLKEHIKRTRVISWLLSPIAIIMLLGTIIDINIGNIFVTSIWLIINLSVLFSYKRAKQDVNTIRDASLLVLDCNVSRKYSSPRTLPPGVVHVFINYNENKKDYGPFRARFENLDVGTKCLLVYIKHQRGNKYDRYMGAFTDFMLSEEGFKLRI